MKIDGKGNQIPEPSDMINVQVGARVCRCRFWRLAIFNGELSCSGCLLSEPECRCRPISQGGSEAA